MKPKMRASEHVDISEESALRFVSDCRLLLAETISDKFDTWGVTQAEISARTGLTQPRVSNLVRGKLDGYTVDGLLKVAYRSGMSPDFVFGDSHGIDPFPLLIGEIVRQRTTTSHGNATDPNDPLSIGAITAQWKDPLSILPASQGGSAEGAPAELDASSAWESFGPPRGYRIRKVRDQYFWAYRDARGINVDSKAIAIVHAHIHVLYSYFREGRDKAE